MLTAANIRYTYTYVMCMLAITLVLAIFEKGPMKIYYSIQ